MLSTSPLEPATCDAFRSHTTKRKPRTTLGESERGREVLVQDGNPRTQKGRVGKSRPLLSTVFAVSTRVGSLLPLHMAERLAFSPATPESVCVCVCVRERLMGETMSVWSRVACAVCEGGSGACEGGECTACKGECVRMCTVCGGV